MRSEHLAASRCQSVEPASALTVVELRLNREGRGEGTMSFAARITAEDGSNTIALENYDKAPVLLKQASRMNDPATDENSLQR